MNCRSNYDGEVSTAVFSFPKNEELKKKRIKFVNKKDWTIILPLYASNILKKNIIRNF